MERINVIHYPWSLKYFEAFHSPSHVNIENEICYLFTIYL